MELETAIARTVSGMGVGVVSTFFGGKKTGKALRDFNEGEK